VCSLALTARMYACMGGAGACAHHAAARRADADPILVVEPVMSASQTATRPRGATGTGARGCGASAPAPRRARARRGGDRREQLEPRRGLDDLRALRQREPARVRQRRQHRQHVRGRQVRVLDQQPAPARHGLRAAGARARPSDRAAFAARERGSSFCGSPSPGAVRRHGSRALAGRPHACRLTRPACAGGGARSAARAGRRSDKGLGPARPVHAGADGASS